jgi:hypothetical protein
MGGMRRVGASNESPRSDLHHFSAGQVG